MVGLDVRREVVEQSALRLDHEQHLGVALHLALPKVHALDAGYDVDTCREVAGHQTRGKRLRDLVIRHRDEGADDRRVVLGEAACVVLHCRYDCCRRR